MYKGGAGAVRGPWGSAWGGQRGGEAGHGDAETSETQPRARGARRHPPGTTLPSSPAPGGGQLETSQWTTTLQKKRVFPPKCSSVVCPSPVVSIWGWRAAEAWCWVEKPRVGCTGQARAPWGSPPLDADPRSDEAQPWEQARLEDSTVCPGGPTGWGGQQGPEQGRVPLQARGRAGTGGRSPKASVPLAPWACGILGPGASQRLLPSCIPVQTSAGVRLPHSQTSL